MDAKPSHSAETTHSKGMPKKKHGKHQHEHTEKPESNDAPKSPLPSADPSAKKAPGTSTTVSPPGAPSSPSPQHAYLGSVVKKGDHSSAEAVHDPSQGSPAQDTQQPSKPLLYGSRTVLFPRPSKDICGRTFGGVTCQAVSVHREPRPVVAVRSRDAFPHRRCHHGSEQSVARP
ncbi:hypothetical protein MTO96_039323, partial [Rhipicephalus appendiculatus]